MRRQTFKNDKGQYGVPKRLAGKFRTGFLGAAAEDDWSG